LPWDEQDTGVKETRRGPEWRRAVVFRTNRASESKQLILKPQRHAAHTAITSPRVPLALPVQLVLLALWQADLRRSVPLPAPSVQLAPPVLLPSHQPSSSRQPRHQSQPRIES
jgi:hypothetical protein